MFKKIAITNIVNQPTAIVAKTSCTPCLFHHFIADKSENHLKSFLSIVVQTIAQLFIPAISFKLKLEL